MLRYDIINWLIEKYGYETYLEIGVADRECYDKIKLKLKMGVDPNFDIKLVSADCCACTSDEFFDFPKRLPFDIIFIDGDHHHEQVERDINNSLKHLADGGTIVVHDCNPPTQAHTVEPGVLRPAGHYAWCGSTWKAWVKTRLFRKDLVCRCVDADWGCGIIQRGSWVPYEGQMYSEDAVEQHLTFRAFEQDREQLLNLITVDEFKEIYNG